MNWKKLSMYAAIVVVSAAVVFGIRALRIKQIEQKLETVELVNGLLPEKVHYRGENYLIPPMGVYDTGNTNEDIPSIDEPQLVSIASIDAVLADDVDGIVVEKDGEAQFYSLQILRWHEVVNSEIGGDAIAVTHCSLCHSSNVLVREYDGKELHLSISGLVYNNMSLLQDDQTKALWLQGRGMSVVGKELGESLETYEHQVMTWQEFKDAYPSGTSLSMETGYDFDYGINPYTNYDESSSLYFPLTHVPDELILKWMVDGLVIGDEAMAFPRKIMFGFGAENITLGEQSFIAVYDFEADRTRVFAQGENERMFSYDFETEELTDDETGSLWNAEGLAVEGELAGTQLEQVQTFESFWFCWYGLYPHTSIVKIDSE